MGIVVRTLLWKLSPKRSGVVWSCRIGEVSCSVKVRSNTCRKQAYAIVDRSINSWGQGDKSFWNHRRKDYLAINFILGFKHQYEMVLKPPGTSSTRPSRTQKIILCRPLLLLLRQCLCCLSGFVVVGSRQWQIFRSWGEEINITLEEAASACLLW